MRDARSVRRAQLAVATLGATAVLLVIAIAYDAMRFHGLTTEPHLAFALLDALVIARATVSLVRALRGQRAFLRRLPVLREIVVHGHAVRVVPGRSGVFCAGLLRPAVYVTEGTLRAGRSAELRAILAHEEHHRARRDPAAAPVCAGRRRRAAAAASLRLARRSPGGAGRAGRRRGEREGARRRQAAGLRARALRRERRARRGRGARAGRPAHRAVARRDDPICAARRRRLRARRDRRPRRGNAARRVAPRRGVPCRSSSQR